jgi:hypothetical protein
MVNYLIVALLVCVLVYGFILSRRIDKLWKALADIGPALMEFSGAVDRTEKSVEGMQKVSDDIASGRRPFGQLGGLQAVNSAPLDRKRDLAAKFFTNAKRRVL